MTTEQSIEQHQRLWSEHFWETNVSYNGLWTVHDPIASAAYGDHLFRTEVPAGTRIYNENNPGSCSFSPSSMKKLEAANCPTTVSSFLFQGAAGACLPLLKKTYRDLKLRAYAHSFGGVDPKGCNSENRAFVWVNLSDLPDSAFANFDTNKAPSPGDKNYAEAQEIQALWQEDTAGKRWSDVPAANLDHAKSYIMGCTSYSKPSPTIAKVEPPKSPTCDLPADGLDSLKAAIFSVRAPVEGF